MLSRRLAELRVSRLVELLLSGALLVFSFSLLLRPTILLNRPFTVDSVWMVLLMLFPLGLSVIVLYEVFHYWYRLGVAVIGTDEVALTGEKHTSRLILSVVFCILGVQCLWGVTGSYYTLVSATSGGLLAAPVIALLSGTLLGVIILAQTVLSSIFPESDVGKLRDPVIE